MSTQSTQQSPRRPTGYVNVPSEVAARVRSFVSRWGLKVTSRAWGIDSHTVTRAAAGFVVQGLVLQCITEGLLMPEDELLAFERAKKVPRDRAASAGR